MHQSNILTVYTVQQGEQWVIVIAYRIEKRMLSPRSYFAGARRKQLFFNLCQVGISVSSYGIQLMYNADAQCTIKGRGQWLKWAEREFCFPFFILRILCLNIFLSCLKNNFISSLSSCNPMSTLFHSFHYYSARPHAVGQPAVTMIQIHSPFSPGLHRALKQAENKPTHIYNNNCNK